MLSYLRIRLPETPEKVWKVDEESPVTAVPMKGRCEEVIFPFFLGASGVGCATTPLFIHRGMPLGQPSVVGSGGAMCVCMCLCGVLVSVMSRPGGAGPAPPSSCNYR